MHLKKSYWRLIARHKTIAVIVFAFLFFFGNLYKDSPQPPRTYTQAKKIARQIFATHRETLYCRCLFDQRLHVDLKSCHMTPSHTLPRIQRVTWEHITPVEEFGQHFSCWQKPLCYKKNGKYYRGRKCCEHIDKTFQQAEAELYNLWPAVAMVNQARGNFRFGMIKNASDFYGCPIKIDKILHRVEPPDFAKGIVARASLFMADFYHLELALSQRKLFNRWHRAFPPTPWEKEWATKVEKIEGYPNPYIQHTSSLPSN